MKLAKNKKGFSFMEVMVTIAILSAGLLAILTLVANSISNAINSRDGIIASELAQEGIELVRNFRDNNLINNETSVFSDFPTIDRDNCRIDKDSMVFNDSSCNSNSKKLYLDNSGFYIHSGATETKFQRKLIVDYDTPLASSAVRSDVYSIVIWGGIFPSGSGCDSSSCNAASKCICVRDVLTEW